MQPAPGTVFDVSPHSGVELARQCLPPPPPPPCREPVKPAVMGLSGLSVPFVASERHSSRVGVRSACTLLLAFGVLCAGPAEVQAQGVVTLVSNLGQLDGFKWRAKTSQAFTTGGNAVGYRLESITLSLDNFQTGRGVGIRIFPSIVDHRGFGGGGSHIIPDESVDASQIVTMVCPGGALHHTLYTCTAPANTMLNANTTYMAVLAGRTRDDKAPGFDLHRTTQSQDDEGGAAGWSLGDETGLLEGVWTEYTNISYRMSIAGVITDSPPTGAPSISGMAQVGVTLTADTSGIMDVNGLDTVTYSYQWIRVDGAEMDISGATNPTYVPVDDDEGKTLKVRVSFTDDAGNSGMLTSAATAGVMAPAVPALVSNTAVVVTNPDTMQPVRVGLGLGRATPGESTQSFHTGDHSNGYDLESVGVYVLGTSLSRGQLTVYIYDEGNGGAPGDEVYALTTPVTLRDDMVNMFSAPPNATLSAETNYFVAFKALGSSDTAFVVRQVSSPDEDTPDEDTPESGSGWSIADGYHLYGSLSGNPMMISVGGRARSSPIPNMAATGVPLIRGTVREGQLLTANTSGIADRNGLGGVSYGYQWVRVSGGGGADISGATMRTYTVGADDVGAIAGAGRVYGQRRVCRNADQRGDGGGGREVCGEFQCSGVPDNGRGGTCVGGGEGGAGAVAGGGGAVAGGGPRRGEAAGVGGGLGRRAVVSDYSRRASRA